MSSITREIFHHLSVFMLHRALSALLVLIVGGMPIASAGWLQSSSASSSSSRLVRYVCRDGAPLLVRIGYPGARTTRLVDGDFREGLCPAAVSNVWYNYDSVNGTWTTYPVTPMYQWNYTTSQVGWWYPYTTPANAFYSSPVSASMETKGYSNTHTFYISSTSRGASTISRFAFDAYNPYASSLSVSLYRGSSLVGSTSVAMGASTFEIPGNVTIGAASTERFTLRIDSGLTTASWWSTSTSSVNRTLRLRDLSVNGPEGYTASVASLRSSGLPTASSIHTVYEVRNEPTSTSGNISLESLDSGSRVILPGAYDTEITRARLRVSESVGITHLAFAQVGSANLSSLIDSVYVETFGGVRIAQGYVVDNRIEFRLGNDAYGYRVNGGNWNTSMNLDLVVKARLRDSMNGQTIRLDLGSYSDSSRGIINGVRAVNIIAGTLVNVTGRSQGPTLSLTTSVNGDTRASVGISSSSPSAQNLTVGTFETEVARIDISSSGDGIRLTDMYLENIGSMDLASRVRSVGLYDTNGNYLGQGIIENSRTVRFSLGSYGYSIPRSSTRTLSVRMSFQGAGNSTFDVGGTLRLRVGSSSSSTVNGTVSGVRIISENTLSVLTNPFVSTATTAEHRLSNTSGFVSL